MTRLPLVFASILAAGLSAAQAAAETWLWVDADGVTHVTDDPAAVPEAARDRLVPEGEARARIWADGVEGPPVGGERSGGERVARARRLVAGALDELRAGETARARASLEAALRSDPDLAEAHWYLALLEHQRGQLGASAEHLQDFLATAGEELAPWRASAERRLARLADEQRLADPSRAGLPGHWLEREHPHFRLELDPALASRDGAYLATVVGYLEEARAQVATLLGVVPAEPTGVVLYGRAAYLQAHRHRFTFQTVGFFDGRIHVSSAAHPAGEMRALLFHELVHAAFRERTGGDRPYWLNEGLAELAGRAARGQGGLSLDERRTLRAAIEDGRWVPLARLDAGFSGLTDVQARAAYLQSAAAASWLLARTSATERAELLRRLGAGEPLDEALRAVVGVDGAGLDAAIRAGILGEFPAFAP